MHDALILMTRLLYHVGLTAGTGVSGLEEMSR